MYVHTVTVEQEETYHPEVMTHPGEPEFGHGCLEEEMGKSRTIKQP
jgi:hypothetical protein